MKSNQSIHLSIKEPPNPEPVTTLGIFTDLDNPAVPQLIQSYIVGINFEPKDSTFEGNVKDEVLKLIANQKILGVSRKGLITSVHFSEK